ncbi:MAG TPA: penicillin acylase family protein [Gemmatimonadaceae bacterium]
MPSRLRPLLWIPLAVAVTAAATPAAPTSPIAGTEILWDSYGVPHIRARTREGLAYGFGWAQMRNHADLLLRLVAQARGRAAEYLGPDYADEDRWVWTLGMPARAERWYGLQRPETRAHLRAFVDGINAFARAHPELVSDSVRAILPVTPTDVMAHLQRVLYSKFLVSSQRVDAQTRAWRERGSNAWAIAPKRSASGHTLLLENPHLPWSDEFTWTEAQYTAPGVDVYGAALILSPVLQIAFNDHLGWSHTVNTQDGVDLYDVRLSGDGYMLDGRVMPFERSTHVMRIRQADGTLRADTLHLRGTVQGPVVAEKAGAVIALSAVGIHGPALPFAVEQWWNMGRARNFAEFLAAIRPNQISGQNITYADRDGHIMMFYGGNTPARPRGDRAYWSGIVPGDSSSTLWNTLIPFDDMPRTVDPPSGWVQNANDPPWWSTFPPVLDPRNYPPYLASLPMAFRPQHSARMLDADSSITFDELLAYKHSTRLDLADRVLDDLLPAAHASSDSAARHAADILDHWDRAADSSSRGAVLFEQWWTLYGKQLRGRGPFAIGWSPRAPRTTPDGLADTALAVQALAAADRAVASSYGAADVPWGSVYRLRRDSVDLPASGASGELGAFQVLNFTRDADGRFSAVGGTSYVAAVEFSTPVRARSLVTYGNASQRGSKHRTDQIVLFAHGGMKTVWRTRAEVLRHLELREEF